MKKFLLIALLMVATFVSANAQTESSHLLFKGIPIDGKISSFVAKLQQKGYVVADRPTPDKIMLTGKFSGEDVTLKVEAAQTSHTACCVYVFFPVCEKWVDLELFYKNLTSSYINKYGEPLDSKHEFLPPYDNPSSILQMQAVEEGKCNYSSTFRAEHGIIIVDILNLKLVRAVYIDAMNYHLYETEQQDDL
jgi:hypothetical protein